MSDGSERRAYLTRLQRITAYVDPLAPTSDSEVIQEAANSLQLLPHLDRSALTNWVSDRPRDVYTLGLAVGLSQEKLKNLLRSRFGTSSWRKVASEDPAALVEWLDVEFHLLAILASQARRIYSFGDVLVARGTTRQTATSGASAGLLIENAVETIVRQLGLPYQMRGRFLGRNGETGPADLVIPSFNDALIAVACKGFDSTGSKLTAAVTEVQAMAEVRFASQYVFAVVDGIGWNSRQGDFRRLFSLYETHRIDGLYALADLARFTSDLVVVARRHNVLP